jgi:hypothetical protein
MRLRLDPWPAEYASALQIGEFQDEPADEIDYSVEGREWMAVEPASVRRPEPLHFVDGVLRVDARVILDDQSDRIIYGLFGSVAAGAVRVEKCRAQFESPSIGRFLITGAGVRPDPRTVECGNTRITFEPYPAAENEANTPLRELQNRMRSEEAGLAELLARSSACLFSDGPLTYFADSTLSAVGIIKRLREPYLAAPRFALVRSLRPGHRTPLFLIRGGKHERYSWYLRAGAPRLMDHDLAGVLRLEVRSGIGIDRAQQLAQLSAACVPDFAGDSIRDPRSPQNLLPVAALEHDLRRRLGDPLAIRRAIERLLHYESTR